MKIKEFLNYETAGFILVIISFILGDKIPTSLELRWTIVTLFFVLGIITRLKRIEDKLK